MARLTTGLGSAGFTGTVASVASVVSVGVTVVGVAAVADVARFEGLVVLRFLITGCDSSLPCDGFRPPRAHPS